MRWALVSCVLWPMVAFAERVDPPGASADAKLTGHALVWRDALWYLDETESSLTLKLATLSGADRKSSLGDVVPVKVIRGTGERIEVELATASCTRVSARIEDLESVRFFVARKDFAPVVSKKYTMTYKNGSRITLRPGTPVIPTKEEGVYTVDLDPGEVDVTIPSSSIGYTFTPVKPTQLGKGDKGFALGQGDVPVEATLGTRTFTVLGGWAFKVTKRKADVLFPMTGRCVEAAVVVAKESVRSSAMRSRIPSVPNEKCQAGCPDPNWTFPKGTVLRTPGGRVVARTAKDVGVVLSTSMDDTKEVCREFEVWFEHDRPGMDPYVFFGDGPRRKLDLCAPTSATQ